MFRNAPAKDHGSRQIKFLLRQALLPRLKLKVVLDLFAGRGEIAARFYLGGEELYLVEKNPKSFAFLARRFEGKTSPEVHLYCEDNLKFLAARVAGLSRINLVDFDAYGSPNRQIKRFFSLYRVREPMLVFATDGGKLALLRGAHWHPDWYSAREADGPPASRYHALVARDYETLIRGFWREMAAAHGFRLLSFPLVWKPGNLVAYYGLLLQPV